MARKGTPLDPGLKSLLESIRQTVGGEAPPAAPAGEEAELPSPAPQAAAPAPALPPADGRTVEQFLADLIRPQVSAWLDAHLPEIVQKLAAEEIRRLTGK